LFETSRSIEVSRSEQVPKSKIWLKLYASTSIAGTSLCKTLILGFSSEYSTCRKLKSSLWCLSSYQDCAWSTLYNSEQYQAVSFARFSPLPRNGSALVKMPLMDDLSVIFRAERNAVLPLTSANLFVSLYSCVLRELQWLCNMAMSGS
jgi:hypothetical protein